jgi:glucan-binding YG repeat protein
MSKMRNKFIALFVVLTSIISFLPVEFGGQVAKAATTVNTDATSVQVNVTGSTTALTPRTDSTTNEQIYTTENVTDSFDITLKDVMTTTQDLEDEALQNNQSTSGIIKQQIDIVSINGVSNETDAGRQILSDIGITIADSENPPNATVARVGKKVLGLPLGVNKIVYKITITTQDVTYTAVTDDSGKVTSESATPKDPVIIPYANQGITIEHATTYVVNKINPMTFKAYVGQASSFNDSDEISDTTLNTNNTVPFLYSTEAKPDANMALRYTFDVPDSISTLKYVMTFDDTMTLDGAKVYKNGSEAIEGTEYTIDGHKLTGNLSRLGQSDLIMVKLNSSNNSNDIQKTYAIEIRYNNLSSDKDFSLKDSGITKLDYNDDTSVPAYIGKKFAISKDSSNSFNVYNGDIYIDPRARMISMDPNLIRSKNTVAYVVTNNYVDSSGTTKVKQSILKDGKQFVDFMASTTSNEIQVDVYKGSNGNISDSSTILARYHLKVHLLSGSSFSMNLSFNSSEDTYLTQPGVSRDNNGEVEFAASRRTYDLYTGDPVTVSFNGARSDKNEYIRAWLADDVNSTNLQEAQASKDNNYGDDSTDTENYLKRNTSLYVTIGTAKKMVVQAYYDEFEDQKQADGTMKKVLVGSYPVGDSYVFYLPNNYDNPTNPSTGENSNNASLNSLKIKGYTLTDSDGTSGFSSDKLDYTTTVAKEDTTEKITAIAQDDNIESIVATVDGNDTTYDLVSGEASDIPLNTSGQTTIQIVVTAQDGTTTKAYTIVVKNNSKGSDANLKNVVLNVGDYSFDPKEDVTKVRVDQNVTNIKVTPIPEDSKATTSVNGEDYSDSAVNVSLKGAQKTEISIEVTSEDGTESKTYTLEVYRVDVADWNNDSDNSNNSDEDDQFYDEYNDCWVDLTKYDEWGSVNGKPAYFDKKNRQVKNAWIYTGGKYYYLNNLGYRASGWKVDDITGKTYYLDPTTGEMRKGWMNLNNSWYYLGQNGVMQKGWLYANGKWYYFTPNGQLVVNQSMYVDGKVYNFGQDGAVY